jgi:hypothetical protein
MKTFFNNVYRKALLTLVTISVLVELILVTPAFAQIKWARNIHPPRTTKNSSDARLQAMVNQMENSLKFRVQFEEYSSKPVRVLVQEQKGKIIFSELIYKPKYIGRFDLSDVKEGTYHFIITSDTETYKQSFHIRNIIMRMVTKAEDYPPLVQRTK